MTEWPPPPRPDLPRPDLPRPDLPRPDLPRPDLPHPDLPHPDLPQSDPASPEPPEALSATGHPAVDAALHELVRIASAAPADQVPAYQAAHRTLRETLASIDEQ